MSTIKDKIIDLGMTSSARRVFKRASVAKSEESANDEITNKLMKMMKARRGGNRDNPEGFILSP